MGRKEERNDDGPIEHHAGTHPFPQLYASDTGDDEEGLRSRPGLGCKPLLGLGGLYLLLL